MSQPKTLSYSTTVILQALAYGYKYGFDVMEISGLPSGTVYPALRRLENAGLLKSDWEDEELAQNDNRPPRKYYEVTNEGFSKLEESLARYKGIQNIFPVSPEPKPLKR